MNNIKTSFNVSDKINAISKRNQELGRQNYRDKVAGYLKSAGRQQLRVTEFQCFATMSSMPNNCSTVA